MLALEWVALISPSSDPTETHVGPRAACRCYVCCLIQCIVVYVMRVVLSVAVCCMLIVLCIFVVGSGPRAASVAGPPMLRNTGTVRFTLLLN